MIRLLLLLSLLLPVATQASQPIYKSTDAQGNVVFTDKPPAEGTAREEVTLRRLNTQPAPDMSSAPAPRDIAPEAEPAVARTVTITSPADQTVIPMGQGDFTVEASAQPPLSSGEKLVLQIDGAPVGDAQTNGRWALTNVLRGGHDLTVVRLGASGAEVARSPSVHVQVMRPYNIQNRN
ncbi:MAG: hypothetical protein CME43_06670 [Haliea sp.]|uniref:DUF4124 domain-containing protein n=1 Tax=Haliea sp. TaxID=1932666 RepID=UPI000C3620C9|nr:DUF4124 domain-containing protein [Haliea sp.]MBM69146.1 hypothetical protein [Haliea sp.]|tara:strand:+ start:52917 stop:53453 length:537 start_codon:yes stop_codon:yes gene_type:complete